MHFPGQSGQNRSQPRCTSDAKAEVGVRGRQGRERGPASPEFPVSRTFVRESRAGFTRTAHVNVVEVCLARENENDVQEMSGGISARIFLAGQHAGVLRAKNARFRPDHRSYAAVSVPTLSSGPLTRVREVTYAQGDTLPAHRPVAIPKQVGNAMHL